MFGADRSPSVGIGTRTRSRLFVSHMYRYFVTMACMLSSNLMMLVTGENTYSCQEMGKIQVRASPKVSAAVIGGGSLPA
jgi:hypothetical protein